MLSLFKTKSDTPSTTTNANSSAEATRDLSAAQPAVDALDTGTAVVLYADLPGVTQDQLEVQLEANRLTIRGTPALSDPTDLRLVHRERGPRRYERTFVLSDTIDAQAISAQLTNGVLRLTLPRKDAVAPRKIAVRAN